MAHPDSRKISPVPQTDWPGTISQFSKLNRGRNITVERYGGGKQHEHMETAMPLQSISYDPQSAAGMLTIAVGRDRIEHEYRVEAPRELWVETPDQEKGEMLEIVDKEKRHTVISIE